MKIPFTNWEIRAEKQPRPGPWDDFWYQSQTFESSTGIDVTEDNSLTYFAVWACRKIISEDLGSIPLHLYRRSGEGRVRATDQRLYYLLHDAPNEEMGAMAFREALQGHVLSHGNGYAQIIRDGRGDPLALWPLNPGEMEIERSADNRLIYKYKIGADRRYFAKDEILHIHGLGYNGLVGYNPIKYWANVIGCGLAEQEFQGSTYKNGAFPTIAITHPAPQAPAQPGRDKFREDLKKEYGGRKNAGKILTLWEGMKAEQLGFTMEDTQIIESRKLTWVQICSIHRIPPHKVMNLYHATFSNIENQDVDYAKSTIRPWAVQWEQAINQRILRNSEEYYVEHNLDGLMRGDLLSRYQAYSIGRQYGWLTVNEIRERENLNPVEGGNTRLEPLNMVSIDEKGQKDQPSASLPAIRSIDDPITEEEKEQAAVALRRLRLIKGAR